jgi:hypothetical protein
MGAHAGSGASNTELTVTDYCRDWGGDLSRLQAVISHCLSGNGLKNKKFSDCFAALERDGIDTLARLGSGSIIGLSRVTSRDTQKL